MKILLAGGSGLIGTHLTNLLLAAGHEVAYLTRTPRRATPGGVRLFGWDVAAGHLDEDAVRWADGVVNLAGAGVMDGRWTAARKRELLTSRVQSTRLLTDALARVPHHVKVFVGASAIGLYGDRADQLLTEATPPPAPGVDFLADVCRAWEEATARAAALVRTVTIRIGIVLAREGGALPQMAAPVRLGVGAPLGNGQQWVSWIHIHDLAQLFGAALAEPAYRGVYNGVAPQPARNAAFTSQLAQVLHRPLWLPAVPGLVLRLALGERSQAVLGSQRVTSPRQTEAGFVCRFPTLEEALADLYAA